MMPIIDEQQHNRIVWPDIDFELQLAKDDDPYFMLLHLQIPWIFFYLPPIELKGLPSPKKGMDLNAQVNFLLSSVS